MARDLFDEVHEEELKIHQDLRNSASTLDDPTVITNVSAGTQRPALPPPETHAFSQKAWQKAHPKGHLKTAVKQAKAKGYRVID
jgi:hypothetical protein